MVYHGLATSDKIELYETGYPYYMLSHYKLPKNFPARGFTLFSKLDRIPVIEPPEQVAEKIRDKFYDKIIYGRAYGRLSYGDLDIDGIYEKKYIHLAVKYYKKSDIHLIDGDDGAIDWAGRYGLHGYVTVWKTHLLDASLGNPISLAIPESQLIKEKPQKEKLFAYITPADPSTYIYYDEKEYYNDYATSYYGISFKKSQWEAVRHYEILANRCIPYYHNISEIPPLCMVNFPKSIIKETNKYAEKNQIHPDYDNICEELFEYTKSHLLTKHLVKHFE